MAKALRDAIHGPWFHFEDKAGTGYCQPDLVLLREGEAFVLECKLSDVAYARTQLTKLYLPIVEHVYERTAYGIVVTKHLTRESSTIADSLERAIALAKSGIIPTLHYLGRGPL